MVPATAQQRTIVEPIDCRQPPLDNGGKLGAPKPPGDRIRIAAGRAGTRRSLRRVYAQQPGKRVAASRQQALLQQGPR